ncbi:MAG: hypothetical protein AAB270_06540 [Chloroflexota bacterium]
MRLNKVWIAVAAAAVLLVATLGGTALAQTPPNPEDGWQQMSGYCHGGAGGGGAYFDQVTLSRIAKVLSLTPQDLTTQLNSGKSVADVVQDQGVALEKVVDTLVAPYRDRLQVSVSYGYFTQEEADELLQQQVEWLKTRLSTATTSGTRTPYRGGMMGGSGGGAGWGGMMGGWW